MIDPENLQNQLQKALRECASLREENERLKKLLSLQCQKLQTEDGGTLLQIEKVGGWRKFVGMSTVLNIVFHQVENTVNAEIGAGRWIDKAATGTVAIFILWPLALTAGIGAWQQLKMPERVFEHIATFLGPYAHRTDNT